MTGVLRIDGTWDGGPARPDERIEIELANRADGDLRIQVRAAFHGDPPPPARPGPTDRLWEFEVVELFLAGPATGPPAERRHPYLEVELGPHGHHLALRFLGIRNPVERALAIEFEAAIHGARWQGEARIAAACLPPRPWSANAFATHGCGAARRYLAAIPLPGPRPDFHQPDRFPPLPL